MPIARLARIAAICVLGSFIFSWPAAARDIFVMLSGGDSPNNNNYSQYLQARAVTAFFEKNYPSNSVWVFFGAGNAAGQPSKLSDVYREQKRDGVLIDTWLPGVLPRNRPATREEFLPALRREILPAISGGGTLYLFVGDHGSRTHGRDSESEITLWGLYPNEQVENGWDYNDKESLSVSELRRIMTAGIGKGRVVFVMTQCHSGGFHYLAMAHDLAPDPAWFTALPSWMRHLPAQVNLRIAGFTATDELSLASGCDPSPDPDEWAGYERYLPENLLGENLFNMQPAGKGTRSFAEAHLAATLEDETIDKPYSTSEQYLERWATLIETHLVRESDLTPAVKKAVAQFERTLNGTAPRVADAAFRERQAQFDKFIGRLAEKSGSRDLLLTGTQAELEDAIDPPLPRNPTDNTMPQESVQPSTNRAPGFGRGNRRGGPGGRNRPWSGTIRPAWQQAVESGQVDVIPPAALDFEKQLLTQEARGNNYFSASSSALRDEVYWRGGYGHPDTMNEARAEAISLWAAERRDKIIAWAKTNQVESIRSAADRLAQLFPPATAMPEQPGPEAERAILKMTAADRTLFYRRVLAAWEFLIAVNDKPALARLRELTEIERTPLPKGK